MKHSWGKQEVAFVREKKSNKLRKLCTRLPGNLKREIEDLLISAQNNAINTNYVKTKIDNM